jgi:hypothetical protein
MLGRWRMNQIRISRKLITAAVCACRSAGLARSGTRARVPPRWRGGYLFAVVAALAAALSVPGVSRSVVLASSPSVLNWAKQSPATDPPARDSAAMAYDPATGTVVLFGGDPQNGRGEFGDTWVWG